MKKKTGNGPLFDGIKSDGNSSNGEFSPADYAEDRDMDMPSSNPFSKMEPPIMAVGGGILLLLVIFVVFAFSGGSNQDEQEIKDLNTRILSLENRLQNLEKIGSQLIMFESNQAILVKDIDELRAEINQKLVGKQRTTRRAAPPVTKKKKKTAAPAKKKTTTTVKKKTPSSSSTAIYHVVQKGENLYRIGLKYGLKADDIRRMNKLSKSDALRPGQRLKVGD